MIEILVKSAILLLIGGAFAKWMTRSNPSRGHLIWTLVFLGAALIPALTYLGGPKLMIPIPAPQAPVESQLPKTAFTGSSEPKAIKLSQPVASATASSSPLPSTESMLSAIWGFGVLLVVGRYATGWFFINRVRKHQSVPLGVSELAVDLLELAGRIGIKQDWELRQRVTLDTVTAMTWGVLRPVVLLPHDARQWPAERLEAVLLHEFAHVRRRDFASQLLAEFVCALYWFNPLAWLGARAMREVAESAADDVVVNSGVKASDYATQLLQLAAELGKRPRAYARFGVSAMSQSNIENRLKSVLAPSSERRGLSSVQTLATLTFTMLSVAALAGLTLKQEPAGPRSAKDQTEALSRIKKVTVATVLYSGDYDDVLPYVQSTEAAKIVLLPYTKTKDVFNSPTKGAKFEYNLNIGGVHYNSMDQPNLIPVWFEDLGKNEGSPVVGYADGHASVANTGPKLTELKESLRRKHVRGPKSRPVRTGIGGG